MHVCVHNHSPLSDPELNEDEDSGDASSGSSVSPEGSEVGKLGPEDSSMGEEHGRVKSMMPLSFPNECDGSGLLLPHQRNPGQSARKRVLSTSLSRAFVISLCVCACCSAGN